MSDQYEVTLEKNISSLVESQFPAFFREEGPIFVSFVKEYFKWLETNQDISNTEFNGTGHVIVSSKSANIVGKGTNFTDYFSSGDKIAIYKQDSELDYEIHEIDQVVNNNFMSIGCGCPIEFSSSNSWYTTVKEQYNPNYYLRRYLDNRDIDSSAEQFLLYIKETFLKNIPYSTETNLRTFLKHSLDLYRSKGTERAIDLAFRAVHNVPASVYYPGTDLFRLSDGKWYIPTYLEISLRQHSDKLIGKQIVGATSKATAFAEALVRRTVKNRIIDVLYISAVKGNFIVDEPINSTDNVLDIAQRPLIIGSLTELDVDLDGTGANYNIGDVVDLYSDYGEQGKGKVLEVSETTGQVNFTLKNGGYAYKANSEILVSEKIITVSNVQIDANNNGKNYFYMFDSFYQPLANIVYELATGGDFANGDIITTYSAGVPIGIGRVLNSTKTDTSNGYLFVSVLSGDLDEPTIYNEGNAVSATLVTYTDASVTGNTIGYYANINLGVIDLANTFSLNEEVYQADQYGLELANGYLISYSPITSTTGTVRVGNTKGVFLHNKLIRGRTSGATANIQNTQLYAGIMDISNTLYNYDNNYVYFGNSLSNGTIITISQGTLANVGFSTNFIYTETVTIANDYIKDYLTTEIDAATYGFPSYPSGNLTNGTLDQMFEVEAHTIGKVQALTGINKGADYTAAPIVRIYDPVTAHQYRQDVILDVIGTSGIFEVGEVVTQEDSSARGLVITANSSQIWLEQLRILPANDFVVTTNTTTTIVGEQSSATANVTIVDIDFRSEYLGFNANIETEVRTSRGAVTALNVIDSGFGYKKSDSIRFVREGDNVGHEDAGLAFANLVNQGTGSGFYKVKGGFLSDQKKLFDGIYWQEYSYEIRSSITLNKYEEMLKKLLHVSGTKYFGALFYKTKVESSTTFGSTTITVE